MRFQHQTEEEVLNLLREGNYKLYVKQSIDYISKSTGNESIKITLSTHDEKGAEHLIVCFLTPKFMFLFKHFCDAAGLQEKYKSDQIDAEDCMGKEVWAKVGIDKSDDRWRNVIKDFIVLDDSKKEEKTEKVLYNKITGQPFPSRASDAFNDELSF